jgi:heptaprenyl diphosphate synthase
VNPSVPSAHPTNTLSASLGLGERLFASSGEKKFVADIEDALAQVETGLFDEITFADDLADVTSRYLLDAGGKRVRPVLTLLTAQLGGGINDRVITAAKAIEMVHLASLYHDDVMDEAQMRRGVPTAQAVWGNSIAILTGDLLFARASKLVAALGEEAILLQANTFERLCLGQLHETIGPRDGQDPIAHYISVLADKTGSLIAAAAEMGVLFSGAPEEYRLPVVTFGEKIGIAFQLIDDVLDLSEKTTDTGKIAGTDLRSGVSTLPMLYLREEARTNAASAELLDRLDRDVSAGISAGINAGINAELSGDAGAHTVDAAAEKELASAIAELRGHDVTTRTRDEAHRWAREAVAALAPLPEGPVKKALTRFADTVVERNS